MKKKRVLKTAAFCLAVLLIVGVCLFANSLVGNPVSKLLAEKTAEKHLEKHYGDRVFILEGVVYSFKFGYYHAYVTSPSSADSSFSLAIGLDGKLIHDYYEDNVLTGWNTARRLGEEYRLAVDRVLNSPSFPYNCHIGFGDLEFVPREYESDPDSPSYALVTEDLMLDGVYDINKLGAEAGKLTVYVYDDKVSAERLAEILLDVKARFDNGGVSFYVTDFVLEYPRTEEGEQKEGRVEVMNLLYSDIYPEGMAERVRESNRKAEEYYAAEDAKK